MMVSQFLLIGLLQGIPNAPLVDMTSMAQYEDSSFDMGTPDDLMVGRYGDGWYVNQTPQRAITLSPFAIDRYEINTTEYARFLTHACGDSCYDPRMPIDRSDDGFVAEEGAGDAPIVWVDWRSAHWYCRWAGQRLPTEAEWEFAATGTEQMPWPWGTEHGPQCAISTYSFEGGRCAAAPRDRGAHGGGETPSGVNDLSGNAAEWTADWYAPYPAEDAADPQGPPDGTHRVIRGGSFLTSRRQLQPTSRRSAPPSLRSVDLGFRCAWDSSLVDPNGVFRGELDPAGSTGIIPRESPTSASEFEVLATGLDGARALLVLNDVAYIAGNATSYVWREGIITEVEGPQAGHANGADPKISAWTTDGIAAFGIDPDTGTLWRISQGDMGGPIAALEAELTGVLQAVPVMGGWAWTDGANIRIHTLDGDDIDLVSGRVDINALRVDENTIYWTEGGAGGGALLEVPVQGGEPIQRVGPPDISAPLKLWGLTIDDDNQAWLMIGFQSQWPYSGLLCRTELPTGPLRCVTHSPPKAHALSIRSGTLYWAHQYGLSALSAGIPYDLIGDPIAATGFAVTQTTLWVTETATGRLLRLSR